ncbi:MAG TPA: type II secretion system protein [Stenomitos sp.]
MRASRMQQGFTLIELLIVVVIIGILATVAVPNFAGAKDRARNSAVQANVHVVQVALERYAVDNTGRYPTTAEGLNPAVIAAGSTYQPFYPPSPWGTAVTQAITANIAIPNANVTPQIGKNPTDGSNAIAPGALVAPTTVTDFGAISYRQPTTSTANELYELMGSGKKGDNAITVFYVKNY